MKTLTKNIGSYVNPRTKRPVKLNRMCSDGKDSIFYMKSGKPIDVKLKDFVDQWERADGIKF